MIKHLEIELHSISHIWSAIANIEIEALKSEINSISDIYIPTYALTEIDKYMPPMNEMEVHRAIFKALTDHDKFELTQEFMQCIDPDGIYPT